jgi:hypothetical protein
MLIAPDLYFALGLIVYIVGVSCLLIVEHLYKKYKKRSNEFR